MLWKILATKLVIGTFEGEIILIDFENSTTQKIIVVNIIIIICIDIYKYLYII